MKLENGNRVSETKQIEKELEKFYSNMYASKKSEPQGENKSVESFVEGIEIPQPRDHASTECRRKRFARTWFYLKRGGELFLGQQNS